MSTIAAAVSPMTRRTIQRLVIWPSRLITVVLTLLFATGLTVPTWVQFIPLGASLVVFGLPHGAVDHLIVARLMGYPTGRRLIGLIVAAYLALAAGYLAIWASTPAVAFVLFIALTWYHRGQGDLATLLTVENGSYLRTRTQRGLTLIVRGGLPMLIPLLSAPDAYRDVATDSIGVFQPDAARYVDWAFDDGVRLATGIVFALFVLGALLITDRGPTSAERPVWLANVADTVLLVFFFLIVPPILAIGIYFCCWHSTRHIARMIQLGVGSASPLQDGHIGMGLLRFGRAAALPTIAALALLAGLGVGVPYTPDGLSGLTGLYLVGLSLLTLPHTLVVTWLDRYEGIWRRSDGGSARPG